MLVAHGVHLVQITGCVSNDKAKRGIYISKVTKMSALWSRSTYSHPSSLNQHNVLIEKVLDSLEGSKFSS